MKTSVYSDLQRIGVELARGGLIKNAAWLEDNCKEASKMFSNQGLKTPAVVMASVHQYALDYIKQAPVLVVAASQGTTCTKKNERSNLARQFGAVMQTGPKLKNLLSMFGLTMPMRKFDSNALAPSYWPTLQMLAGIPNSTLSQIIPDRVGEQQNLIRKVSSWRETMQRRFGNSAILVEWCARNIVVTNNDNSYIDHVQDIADFAGSTEATFNQSWDWQQAKRAADVWHAMLAQRSEEGKFMEQYGFGWNDPIDYGPLPIEAEVNGLQLVALRSGADLFTEGREMHHCVASYTRSVVTQQCWIYSLRKDGKRVATIELVDSTPFGRNAYRSMQGVSKPIRMQQIKGPCNAAVSPAAAAAVVKFVKTINGEKDHDKE